MTTQNIIDYYANLLILQYKGKPKAYATIQALVSFPIMDQLPSYVQNAYNLDTAVGVQLDVLGKYAGVTRTGFTFVGPYTLSDDDFRTLIRIAIVLNASDGTLASIQSLLNTYFPGIILVFDHGQMRISYYFDTDIGSEFLAQVFIKKGLLPKPMGVQMSSVIYSHDITTFFGFRTYSHAGYNISPFNTYGDYVTGTPFISYANRVNV